MKTKIFSLLLIGASGILLSGCTIIGKPAGLKVETDQLANVFIDGKIVGKTPYTNADIKGKKEITLKIIPEITDKPLATWESKVSLLGGTWTLVKREMAVTESDSSGQIIYMTKIKDKKTASLSVVTEPEGASVFVNREEKGDSPYQLNGLSAADYTLEIKKEGLIPRSFKIKLLAGSQLNAQIKLGQVNLTDSATATISGQPTASPTLTPPIGKTTLSAVSPTPSKTVSVITPAKSVTGVEPARPYVLIKDTEVGFLRVREKPSTSSTEVAKVNPGEKYSVLEENNGWYKIAYQAGKEGWVAGQYVTKYE